MGNTVKNSITYGVIIYLNGPNRKINSKEKYMYLEKKLKVIKMRWNSVS